MAQSVVRELRRIKRKLVLGKESPYENGSDSDDNEWDLDWVYSDNLVGKDDDDLCEDWVDEKF